MQPRPPRPGAARGAQAGASGQSAPAGAAPSLIGDPRLFAASPARAVRGAVRGRCASASRSRRPGARSRDVRRLVAGPQAVAPCDRLTLEPDRVADAERPGRRGLARAGRAGLPHRAARLGSGVRHRRLDRAAPAAARRRGGRGARRGRSADRARYARPLDRARARRVAGHRRRRRRRRARGDRGRSRTTRPAISSRRGAVDAGRLQRSARGRSSTCTSTTTAACSTSRSPRRSTRRCSGCSTGRSRRASITASSSLSRCPTPRTEIGEPVAVLRDRYLPALARLLPAAGDGRGARLHRYPGAARDLPRRPRDAAPAARRAHRGARPLPRRRVDGHRLAGDDGGRGRERRRRRTRGAFRPRGQCARAGGGVRRHDDHCLADDSTRRCSRSSAAATGCFRSSTPTAGGRASWRRT